ncbi:MAG: hypothetical protein EZS28_023706 [Streblomastix strix]|uniref:Uncharacterized protein n=1 Tax=Streblomastix strix TaxID=222440 RepID=A0A5J4VEA8_9EUKA|nr:MAG: hypothetical protein EZS28_023706 [Streblomastix strix]
MYKNLYKILLGQDCVQIRLVFGCSESFAQFNQLFEDIIRLATATLTYQQIYRVIQQEIQRIFNEEEVNARGEFIAEKSQGAGGQQGSGARLIEIDGIEDDYDYYESQAARQDGMKSRAKPFGRLPFHLLMFQSTRKHRSPQFRKEACDVLTTLVDYFNGHIKTISRLSSAVCAHKYINAKLLGKRFSVSEQDLDDNEATPDNVVVFDKKKNAIYSVDGYTTAKEFGDPEHQYKRNWKKNYYSDVNDLE